MRVVLGNHDLHLLAIAAGARPMGKSDTLGEILAAEDRDEMLCWLEQQPLLLREGEFTRTTAVRLLRSHVWKRTRSLV